MDTLPLDKRRNIFTTDGKLANMSERDRKRKGDQIMSAAHRAMW